MSKEELDTQFEAEVKNLLSGYRRGLIKGFSFYFGKEN